LKISIASDHGGFELKQEIIAFLKNKKYEVEDFGTYSKDSCDYPDFGSKAAKAVVEGAADFGIVICTTGIGMSITANKIKGIRAALCTNTHLAEMSRRHNNANVLALGQNNQSINSALEIVNVFLNTSFDGGRHQRRIDKISKLEEN